MPLIQSSPGERNGASGKEATTRAAVEIRLRGGPVTRRALTESPVVIGRVPGVQLVLDDQSVSRRHAEMCCDPFGRWWIHDLNSTNGTLVGEEQVQERALSSGDRITIGDFTLDFTLERDNAAPRSMELSDVDDKPTVIRRLGELEPPRIAAGHLRTLLDFSRQLLEIDEQEARLDALCELLIGNEFCAIMSVVIRVEGSRIKWLSRPHRPGSQLSSGRPYLSRRVLDMVRDTRQPVLATNMSSHLAGPSAVEISMASAVMELWVIACPFRSQGDAVDVLYTIIPRDCGTAEWLNLYALAAEVYHQAEAAVEARVREQERAAIRRGLETARQIQLGLLPRQLDFAGLDVAVGFEPCLRVGGDYVDVVPLRDGRVLFVVADVCGKGLQAALVGASLHTMVRAVADSAPPVADLVERVNRHLCEWLPEHSFVTLVAATLDPATGELECVNAGHPPVMIIDTQGAVRTLQEAENPALGIAPAPMATQSTRLQHGDVLAMYTDGLTELRNQEREELGVERLGAELCRAAVARARDPVEATGEALLEALDAFRGEVSPEDDQTFLLARRT